MTGTEVTTDRPEIAARPPGPRGVPVPSARRWPVKARILRRSAVIALIAVVMLAVAAGGAADAAVVTAPASLNTVINNIRNWPVGQRLLPHACQPRSEPSGIMTM